MNQCRAAGKLDCDRRAAAGHRREFGERQRRERKIGADQFGRRQNRERIDDEMAARRADLVGEIGAEDFCLDGRAARMQRAFDQPRIGRFMLAERNDAGDAGLLGAALEMGELRDIAIDDRRAARLDAEKDLGLGVGDLGQRAEVFQMHRRDRGDDRDMRADQPRQRLDLAFVIHAHFEHGVTRARGAAGERQRHAPVIVVGRDRGVGLAVLRQRKPQRFLGAGLADRAGDADHLGLHARPRGGGEIAQAGKHIGHDEERRVAGKLAAPVGGDRRRGRLWRQAPRRQNRGRRD